MSGELIKASETKYSQLFDQLVADVLADRAKPDTEIPWLSEFLHETGIADCDFIAYYADSLSDQGFSDEWIRDNYEGENLEITDALRVSQGRIYLAGLDFEETYGGFDPGFFDFQVEVSSGDTVTIVIGFVAEGQAGSCFYFMGGFKEGNTLDLVNALGYFTSEQLEKVSDAWILKAWQRDSGEKYIFQARLAQEKISPTSGMMNK